MTSNAPPTPIPAGIPDCALRGDLIRETVGCNSCPGKVKIKLYTCARYGYCTLGKQISGVACCSGTRDTDGTVKPCESFTPRETPSPVGELATPLPPPRSSSGGKIKWAYGVTTVPARRGTLLPKTLTSLAAGGFDKPRLFVDGYQPSAAYEPWYKLEVTTRWPAIRTFGNWVLGLAELYIREPNADRYAMFQDDLLTYPNLRDYLDSCEYPERGYWNLYTFPPGRQKAPPEDKRGESRDGKQEGWFTSNQLGRGALGLVFSREAVSVLLQHSHMIERPQDGRRGFRAIDGGVVTAMNKAGWTEYVHHPSLLYHTGEKSVMGNAPHQQTLSFRGEEYDARLLIKEVAV